MEVMVTMAVIGVLIASSATIMSRTVEQVYADYAGSGLHAIWNAQRMHWVEHRTYASDIATLQAQGMLAESLNSQRYQYAVVSADDETFSVEADRVNSDRWSGAFMVDQTGVITGTVTNGSHVLRPSF